MKNKIIAILAVLTLVIGYLFIFSIDKIITQKSEISRLESNQSALFEEIRQYQFNDSVTAVEVQSLKVTSKEFERLNIELKNELKQAGVRIKDLTKLAQVETEVRIDTIVKLKEVYINDTLKKCYSYEDKYNLFICCPTDSVNAKFNASVQVPLDLWAKKNYRHKVLWGLIKWGRKPDIIQAKSDNTKAEITKLNLIYID